MTDSHYDVIVIGAGIAGLSAAAHLAKKGNKAAVFEQHDKPGGYYTSFTRHGIVFDITAHWTIAHEKVNRMLAGLGAQPIRFIHHPNIGQYFGPDAGGPIRLVNDRERFIRSIQTAYPAAALASIEKLIEESLKVEAEIDGFEAGSPELMTLAEKARLGVQLPFKLRNLLKYSRMPGEKFLKSLFPGDELSGLRAALYMLAPIKDFSAVGMLLYIAFALRGKAYLPEGGAYKAAQAFAEAARLNGADLCYGEKVSHIRVENGRVQGIRLENGRGIDANAVISAADIRQTFNQLLDPAIVPANFTQKLKNTPISGPFVIVSIVTDLDPAAYGFDATDAFYTDTADINAALEPDDPEHSLLSIQFPEFREASADGGLFGLQLVAPASIQYQGNWGAGTDDTSTAEYRRLKENFADRLIARAEKYIPGLGQHIVVRDVATPVTMHRYTLNDQGAPVGWSYTSTERWKQKVPFINGLYLAGHWVGPSGIYNVAISGKNAAELVLRNG